MERTDIIKLLKERVKRKNLIKHMLAAEAAMGALAGRFNEDPDNWADAGLVHDIDYEATKDNFSRHGLDSADILQRKILCWGDRCSESSRR